jgi:AcrR family transcriptional regulator
MAFDERRQRERVARRRLITTTARALAESEGWDVVTTRRLSSQIEYSQPVLYNHFRSMEDIVEAVALEGFDELAGTLCAARRGGPTPDDDLTRVVAAYIGFAATNPAVYDAMFTRSTRLRFGAEDTVTPPTDAFRELREAVAPIAAAHEVETIETLTEVLWAALHGLALLDRNGRRPGHHADRIKLLVAKFCAAGP